MRHIVKGQEPELLKAFRETPGSDYGGMQGNIKNAIRADCGVEQFGLCAFCCALLPPEPTLQRIAHVVPRSVDGGLELTFGNMVVSCSSGRHAIDDAFVSESAQSCDEKQKSHSLPISPLEQGCESRFRYLRNGKMEGLPSDQAAQQLVALLNLDHERLNEGRKQVMELAAEDLDTMERDRWNRIYLEPVNGVLVDFAPAVRSLVSA